MPESPSAVAIFIDLAEDGWASMPDMAAALAPLVRMAAATVVRLPAGRLLRLSMSADGGLRAQPDHTGQPAVFAQEWINQAAMRGWHVLVLLGPTALDDAALTALAALVESDPMFGAVLPRVADGQGWIDRLLPEAGDPEIPALPPGVQPLLPAYSVLPVHFGPALLLSGAMLRVVGGPEPACPDLATGLLLLLGRARRRGFRSIAAHHVSCRGPERPRRLPLAGDWRQPAERWTQSVPDWDDAVAGTLVDPIHVRESFLARRAHPESRLRRTLLIDASFLKLWHEGTTETAAQMLRALDRADTPWRIAVMVPREAMEFHDLTTLRRVEPRFRWGEHRHSVALRLAQPWSMTDLLRLHAAACHSAVLFHDTIAWDVIYPCGDLAEVTEICQAAAHHCDALLFNSRFSRDRFLARFPPAPHVMTATALFATVSDEMRPAPGGPGQPPYVLVLGSALDHKCLAPTMATLSARFPAVQFRCLGDKVDSAHNVEVIPTGELPHERVVALYTQASALVFPSTYEGFGLPVVHGLAAGLPVLALRSRLLDEVAGRCAGPGRLHPFTDTHHLCQQLEAVLAGRAGQGVPLGGDGPPRTWDDVAADILALAERLIEAPPMAPWAARDLFMRALARSARNARIAATRMVRPKPQSALSPAGP